jgi:hypothetical protein
VKAASRLPAVLGCGAGLLAAQSAPAAQWLLAPTAQLSTAYTDNPRLVDEGGTSTGGAVGELGASVTRRTERLELSFEPKLRSARYEADETLDSDDQYLDVAMSYVTERSQWSAELDLTRDTTLTSELDSTGLVQTNRRHESIVFSGGPSVQLTERVSAGLQVSVLDHHYPEPEDTGLVDYQYRALALFSETAASERSAVTVTLQGGELDGGGPTQQTRDATLRLGWTYQPYSLWTARVTAGPSYVDSQFGHDIGAVFDAELQRRGERWTVSVGGGRSLAPAGRGVLTQRDRVTLATNRRFTERLSAAMALQWIRNEDLVRDVSLAVDYRRLDLNLSWRIAENWSVALALGATTLEREDRRADADGYRAALNLLWSGQGRSL